MKNDIISVAEKLFNLKRFEYEISTGLLVKYNGDYVFAIQNPNRWKIVENVKEAGVVGIGGKLEKDETVIECVERECVEELGSGVKIEDSEITYLITDEYVKKDIIKDIENEPRPYFIILLKRTEPGRKPFTVVFSYKGNLLRHPKPLDVAALFLAKDSTLIHLISGPKTAKFLKENSAKIIERVKIPDNLYLRPYGTLSAYLKLLEFTYR